MSSICGTVKRACTAQASRWAMFSPRGPIISAPRKRQVPYSAYTRSMPLFCNMTRLRPWFSNETFPIANFGRPPSHRDR